MVLVDPTIKLNCANKSSTRAKKSVREECLEENGDWLT